MPNPIYARNSRRHFPRVPRAQSHHRAKNQFSTTFKRDPPNTPIHPKTQSKLIVMQVFLPLLLLGKYPI